MPISAHAKGRYRLTAQDSKMATSAATMRQPLGRRSPSRPWAVWKGSLVLLRTSGPCHSHISLLWHKERESVGVRVGPMDGLG